jgi:hypothetical protein
VEEVVVVVVERERERERERGSEGKIGRKDNKTAHEPM